jgi:hypothetical protein
MVLFVIFHEQFPSLVVERAFRKRNDQQTFDYSENVSNVPFAGIPIFLESVDANFAFQRYVRMKNLRQEEA